MIEKKKKVILSSRQQLMNNQDFIERAERDGIELEKGAVITNEYLERNRSDLERWVNFFTAYPDIYLDIIKPSDSEFSLFFYQRMTLRALMRFKDVFITAQVEKYLFVLILNNRPLKLQKKSYMKYMTIGLY